jgi:hypothetical protein
MLRNTLDKGCYKFSFITQHVDKIVIVDQLSKYYQMK